MMLTIEPLNDEIDIENWLYFEYTPNDCCLYKLMLVESLVSNKVLDSLLNPNCNLYLAERETPFVN